MAKKAHRARNWKNYNKSLVSRGSITVWIDKKSFKNWYNATETRRSAPVIANSMPALRLAGGEAAHSAKRCHSGVFCCSIYCLIIESGAPPHVKIQ